VFPVEAIYGVKGLIDKYSSSSLYLAFLVIIHGLWASLRHVQGSRSLRRGGILTEKTPQSGVSTGGLRVGMGSIGLREVKGVKAPEASKPDFTGVTVP
jgi:hypothetical protein